MSKLKVVLAAFVIGVCACSSDMEAEGKAATGSELDAQTARQAANGSGQPVPAIMISEEAAVILKQVEEALSSINSVEAEIVFTQDSKEYGHEKIYQGRTIFEFGGEAGSKGRTWHESEQTLKGRTKHIRGVIGPDGMQELHLLRKKVVKGGSNATSAAWISRAFSRPYAVPHFFAKDAPGLGGDTVIYEGQEKVGGVNCNVLKAYNAAAPDMMSQHYFFGVEDGLLYRQVTSVGPPGSKLVSAFEALSLEINKPIAGDQFELDVPADFAVEIYRSPAEQQTLSVGSQAPEWTLEGADGKQHSLSDYRGQLVLLDFWATWCGPCKAKMPHIQQLHEEFGNEGLKVISVLSGDAGHEEEALEYIEDKGYTFDMVYSNEELDSEYMIRFLPTVILVDAEGKIVHYRDTPGSNEGIDEEKELHQTIANLLSRNQ